MNLVLLMLGLAMGLQDGAAVPQEPVSEQDEVEQTWQDLSPEEQRLIEERRREYDRLPPEAKEELRQRTRVLDEVRRNVFENLTPEERSRLERMPEGEARRMVDQRARRHIEEFSHRFEREFPEHAKRFRGLPMEQRLPAMHRLHEERRNRMIQERIQHAAKSGFLGPRAMEYLSHAPPEEVMDVLAHFGKWEALKKLNEEGAWERMNIDAPTRERLMRLPPEQFGRSMRWIQKGKNPAEAIEHAERGWARRDRPWDRRGGESRRRGESGDRRPDSWHRDRDRGDPGTETDRRPPR